MNVYRISKCIYIDDLSGTGASRFPGRWHDKGTFLLYTAASASLAMLESVVHITSMIRPELCITCLVIPDESITTVLGEDLPDNWFTNPPPDSLKKTGDSFVKDNKYLALKVPSAVMSEEFNILLNPAHALFKKVRVVYTRQLRIDDRLLRC